MSKTMTHFGDEINREADEREPEPWWVPYSKEEEEETLAYFAHQQALEDEYRRAQMEAE